MSIANTKIKSLPISLEEGLAVARRLLQIESDAVKALIPRLDEGFADVVRILLGLKGRVVVTGMGKSGHIGHGRIIS